jgi:uncharacterized protein
LQAALIVYSASPSCIASTTGGAFIGSLPRRSRNSDSSASSFTATTRPISREICEAARAFSLPVLYDVMGGVSVCELLAEEYPDVNFIIPHLGSFADDWKAQVALIDHLVRHSNIYTDTRVRRFDILAQAVQRAGPSKVLFGSDGPWLHPGVELAKVRELGLSRSDEILVLRDNFLRLVKKVGRPLLTRSQRRLPQSSFAPTLSVEAMDRGDPWLQSETST